MSQFLVCLGGSGSKVLESVTHMAAMGQWEKDDLHILMVDVDTGNGNYDRARNTVTCYQSIQEMNLDCHLFHSKIHLYCWSPSMPTDNLSAMGAGDGKGALLGYHLFTKSEREMSVADGFKGHPNLGVLFMQQILDSRKEGSDDDLEQFIQAAKANSADRILLAGSCYGGTGASCIPIIGTYLRKQLGHDIAMGLLAILPSFEFKKDPNSSSIDPNSMEFNDRVKTVLNTYIEQEVLKYHTQQNDRTVELDLFERIYLIGSYKPANFKQYAPGSSLQKNPTTFFDWFTCLAVKDYNASAEPKKENVYTASLKQDGWGWSLLGDTTLPNLQQSAAKLMTVVGLFIAEIYQPLNSLLSNASRKKLKNNPFKYYFQDIPNHERPKTQLNQFTQYTIYLIHWFFQIITTLPDDYFPDMQSENSSDILTQEKLEETLTRLKLSLDDDGKATLRTLNNQKFFSVPAMLHMLRFCQQSYAQGDKTAASEEETSTFLDDAYKFFIDLLGDDTQKRLGVLLPKVVKGSAYQNAYSDKLMGAIFADDVYQGAPQDAVCTVLKCAFTAVD